MDGRLALSLWLEEERGTLRGSIATANGESESFHGWLGLASVLQRLLDEHQAESQPPAPEPTQR